MRNVTILRTKSTVACFGIVQVYIEDSENEELKIDGTPCRKLGELKNGEERNFVVGDQAAKLFVIFDKLSKNICNEFYQLPEGTEDLVLSGQCRYNPVTGNAFRFDNNSDEAVKKNRKKGLKRGIAILVASVVLGVVIGILSNMDFSSDKEFTCGNMQITLTDAFYEEEDISFTMSYYSEDVIVCVDRFELAAITELKNASIESFSEYVAYMYSLGDVTLKKEGDQVYFELANEPSADGKNMHHHLFLYKSDDAFWVVQFMTFESAAEDFREEIFQWANSVTFKKQ